jgi:hypothetical protein
MFVLDVLKSPVTQCALLLCVLAVLLGVSFWGLRRFRDYIGDDQSAAADLVANYGELYEQGVISDVEYRTIKGRLNAPARRGFGGSDRKQTG